MLPCLDAIVCQSRLVEDLEILKTLLCLTTSDNEQGSPIDNVESLRRHLPIRCFGTIEMIEQGTRNFSFHLINDPRNYFAFKHSLNMFYSDPLNCIEVVKENIEIDGIYVCLKEKVFCRCILKKINYETSQYLVLLIDVGILTEINLDCLFNIDSSFHTNENAYPFALSCCTPETNYLNYLRIPSIEDFYVGEVVDIIICSLREPCLAIVGSINRHFSKIHFPCFDEGLDDTTLKLWQSNFTNTCLNFNGVTSGQYPVSQSIISDKWILSIIASCKSLSNVELRSISNCLRLTSLQDIINDFYGSIACRSRMSFKSLTQIVQDLPCVVFDDLSKQYFRAKIVRLSGDRTLCDVIAVDYPDVCFNKIECENLFMLLEKLLIPPQCFSIQLVDSTDDKFLSYNTRKTKHYLDVGTVAAVSLSSKSTIAVLKIDNGEDILEKIGYYDDDSLLNLTIGSKPTTNKVPTKSILKSSSDLTHTFLNKKKFNFEDSLIITICSCNEIYYRTREASDNYAIIKKKIKNQIENFSLCEHLKFIKPNYIYLLSSSLISNELFRVKIISNEIKNNERIICYERVDFRDKSEFFEKNDKFYFATFEIEKFAQPTIFGPVRLSFKEYTDISEDEINRTAPHPKCISKLRTLICSSNLCKLIKNYDFVELFRKDNSSINKDYFDELKILLNDNKV